MTTPRPDVVDHIGYTFTNSSNFDVRKKELDHVLDIPVYPAQNLIVDEQVLNVYRSPSEYSVGGISTSSLPAYIWDSKIYYLLGPHQDQRFVFLEYGADSRLLDYRFGGRVYCQTRNHAGYSLSPDSFYVWGGTVSDMDDMRDLWQYDIVTKTWIPLFKIDSDPTINEFPADRRKSNLVVADNEKFIFGGETYLEIGDTTILLNDLWWHDGTNWKVLDPSALLPHEMGLVVFFDATIIKVLSDGKIWTVYKDGVTATTSVTYSGVVAPLTHNCISYYSDGIVHYHDFVGKSIYKWNNASSSLEKIKDEVVAIGYDVDLLSYYATSTTVITKRGGNSIYQPQISIYKPSIRYMSDDTVQVLCDFEAVPLGDYMASCDIEGGKKYLGLGLRDETFIEDHYIWDGNTNNTARVASDGFKPQERMFAGCCYDEKRNRVWLFGGYTGSLYYNDLWYLDLNTYQWTRLRTRQSELTQTDGTPKWPGARARVGLAVVEDSLWIISGYSDERSYSDMWRYDIVGDYAEKEKLTDWVAFGSDYFVFQWRDRLWMFNGEYHLYRYFYENKQWAKVTIYSTRYPDIAEKIASRAYVTPPMKLSVQLNSLIVAYLDKEPGKEEEWISFHIDLDSKEIIKYPRDIVHSTYWYNYTRSMDDNGYLYFYNVSTFDFAQRNQFPYYEYSVHPISTDRALGRGSNIMPYWDEDAVGGSVERLCYIDANNLYVVYDETEYSPLLPTVRDMTSGLMTNYWPQNDFSVFDGTTDADQIASKQRMGLGRFRSIPRFVWKRVPAGYSDLLRKAAMSWMDQDAKRTYIVNNQEGSILRFRAKDGTFFNYPSRVWPESSLAHRGNMVYAFGGTNEEDSSPPALAQDGSVPDVPDEIWDLLGAAKGPIMLSHMGIMIYDLNYLAFQLRLLMDHPDLKERDYDQVRDYLLDSLRNQLGVNVSGVSNNWLDQVANTLYSDTISVAGDLSVRNLVNEDGIRPHGRRVGCVATQAGAYVYIGGGVTKFKHTVGCPFDPMAECIEVKYVPWYGALNQTTGKYEVTWYNDFYRFDTNNKSWKRLSDLPVNALYGATTIASPDERFLYIIGGYTESDMSGVANTIYVYDTVLDTWSSLNPLPNNFWGRGQCTASWLDDYRLMILFGNSDQIKNFTLDAYIRTPVADGWIIDIQSKIMYKLFENSSKTSMILESIDDDDGYVHLIDYSHVWFSSIVDKLNLMASPRTLSTPGQNQILNESDPDTTVDDNEFPFGKPPDMPSTMLWSRIDPVDGSVNWSATINVPQTLAKTFDPANIIKDFVDTRGDLWFVINLPVVTMEGTTRITNYNMYFYRCAKIDDFSYDLMLLPIDVPLNSGVKLVGHDGGRYLYCIWNEFNIWQLDLDTAVMNPNGEYWRRLPPYPDLADMGILDEEQVKSKPYNQEILFYNGLGLIIRFDPYNFVWRIDRYPDTADTFNEASVVKDGLELYYFKPGETYGRLYGLVHRQEDKFYFDSELLEKPEEFESPVFDAIISNMTGLIAASMGSIIPPEANQNLIDLMEYTELSPSDIWSNLKNTLSRGRATVRRNRIIAFNKNNHMMRSWTKKHGSLDLSLSFDSYYPSNMVDVSVDYDTMDQFARFSFTCITDSGILSGVGYKSQEDTGYDWDPFARNYRKQISIGNGDYSYIESERPGYYVRFDLPANTSIRALRLQFEPKAEEWNYISRINHVYVRHLTDNLVLSDDQGALSVVSIEPFDTVESDVYILRILNNHQTKPANNVKVQLVRNFRILLSKDGNQWKRATLEDPLDVALVLNPGEYTEFFLKAISYYDKSNLDIVVRGEFQPD